MTTSDKTENLNNVAERSRHTTSVVESGHVEQQHTTPVVETEQVEEQHTTPSISSEHAEQQHSGRETSTFPSSNTQPQTDVKQENRVSPTSASGETLRIVSGSVIESTLLQAMSINKVEVELKGIKRDVSVIALAETSRVKGVYVEAGIYNAPKGKLEIFLTSTINKDISLKKGVEISFFQVCKAFHIIDEGSQEDTSEVDSLVYSVQEDLELGKKFQRHLNSTCRPDLEQELINLLLKHKEVVALPRDTLGKTNLLKHQI